MSVIEILRIYTRSIADFSGRAMFHSALKADVPGTV